MKGKIYVIYDKMADDNGPVFQAVNDAVAIREFSQLLENTKYPEDFELLCVAEIDDKGIVTDSKYNVEIEAMKINVVKEDDITRSPNERF